MTTTTEIRPIPSSTTPPRVPQQLLEPPVPISDRWPYPVRSPRGS
jgi:hypothetical protein